VLEEKWGVRLIEQSVFIQIRSEPIMKLMKPVAVALLCGVSFGADKPEDAKLPLAPVDAPKVRDEAAAAADRAARDRAEVQAGRAEMQAQRARMMEDQLLTMQRGQRMGTAANFQGLKLEKATYIGLGTGQTDPGLRAQLKLTPGMGLLVAQVEPQSPAEAAGIKVNDVLEKLNDQLLANSQQFAALVRTFKEGDEVTLSIIRENQRQQVKVKLAEKEQPPLDVVAAMPPTMRAWMGGLGGGATVNIDAGGNAMFGVGGVPVAATPRMTRTAQRSVSINGTSGTLTEARGGHKTLTVTGPDKGVIFDGPIDTPEQRNGVPEQAKGVLDQLEAMPIAPPQVPGMAGAMRVRAMGGMGGGNVANLPGKLDALTWSDDDMTLVLTVKRTPQGRSLHLVAEDPDGKVAFDGAITTDEEKEAVPDNVKAKLRLPGLSGLLDKMRGN
jgi:membrane-associated protease RseP (regulator of RpoE activity)